MARATLLTCSIFFSFRSAYEWAEFQVSLDTLHVCVQTRIFATNVDRMPSGTQRAWIPVTEINLNLHLATSEQLPCFILYFCNIFLQNKKERANKGMRIHTSYRAMCRPPCIELS